MQNKYCLKKILALVLISVIAVNSAGENHESSKDSCILPQHPTNGRWAIADSKIQQNPGELVSSNTNISVKCDGKYALDGRSLVTCKNGKWAPEIGQCLELCPPIVTTPSTIVTCTSNGNTVDDCKKALNGTVATFKCAQFYENAELNRNPFRVCLNGSWGTEVPSCTPICGIKPENSTNTKRTYYPWNVAIFGVKDNRGGEIDMRCAGTLINERIVLTRASCVTNDFGVKISPNLFKLGAGKTWKTYNDTMDTQMQFSEVEDIFVTEDYKGSIRKFTNDIAVVVAKTPFNMSERVQPACFDWNNKYVKVFRYPNTEGFIPGPLKDPDYKDLEEVFEIVVPFINDTNCYSILSDQKNKKTLEALFTYDKLCAAYINSDQSPMCRIDTGVGLVSKNPYNNKYYVTGVLAITPTVVYDNGTCDNQLWVLFTDVSKFAKFITKKIDLYTPIQRSYFQTSCGTKSVQATTLIVNGNNVTKGDYPWQVAIYKITGTNKTLICGGSLINQRVILTAAHCVSGTEGNLFSKNLFVVAVGKYYRNFDDPRDTRMQYSTLKDIFLPDEYRGGLQNYAGDIAILITENSFTLTKDVEPVCIDWEGKYESQFLQPSVSGFVTGWGLTEENDKPSEVLQELEVPYVEREECEQNLPPDFDIYLTNDKLCSGHLDKGSSVCSGDSGGALVFKNKNDAKYYIAGVVSLSPRSPEGGCDSQQLALYTRVSKYVSKFILEKARLYWA